MTDPGRHARRLPDTVGIALPMCLVRTVLECHPRAGWFEVAPRADTADTTAPGDLERLRQNYPLTLDVRGIALGLKTGICPSRLRDLAALCHRLQPLMVTGQLPFVAANPAAGTRDRDGLAVACRNITRVQDALQRQIVIRNSLATSGRPELRRAKADFLTSLVERTGCGLILEVDEAAGLASGDQTGTWPIPEHAIAAVQISGRIQHSGGVGTATDADCDLVGERAWGHYSAAIGVLGKRPVLVRSRSDMAPLRHLLDAAHWAELLADWVQMNRQILAIASRTARAAPVRRIRLDGASGVFNWYPIGLAKSPLAPHPFATA